MYDCELELLRAFTQVSGPSSYEVDVQQCYIEKISKYVTSCQKDTIGNIVAYREGNHKKRIMLVAHADEIGLIINYITDNGLLHFAKIGGVDIRTLPGSRVIINHQGKLVNGIIGTNRSIEPGQTLECKDLWVDIGATSKSDALEHISVGDSISFAPGYTELCNNLFSSKALDDRVGLVIMSEIARRVDKCVDLPDLFFVSSVQEEIGSRGVTTALYDNKPDLCIALDVTFSTDYPGIDKRERGDISLSKGVVISFGADVSLQIQESFKAIAEKLHIPFQLAANGRSSCTDASKVQLSRSGILSGLLSVPCRYMHSSNEVISLFDLDALISLLIEFIKSYPL